ncbi:uncharacterized protein [Rhodnius prolixus]|uniref:uncharacterized protein n=1 Tax=Rhodnius prolixus TaxID=13249 RepID=UPI003D18BDA5
MDIKINELEKDAKRRNVILFGVAEEFRNYWDMENFVCTFFKERLELPLNETHIDFVRRLGKSESNKARPILIAFTQLRSKLLVLKNSPKLKGSTMNISEDFPQHVVEIRKQLLPKFWEARKAGKFAILRYDKLIIKDKNSSTELDNSIQFKKRLLSVSPPTNVASGEKGNKEQRLKKTKPYQHQIPSTSDLQKINPIQSANLDDRLDGGASTHLTVPQVK